jgi:hypothetical protein
MMVPPRRYLVEGIVNAAFTSTGLLRGKTPDLVLLYRTTVMLDALLLLRTSLLK